MISPNNLMEEDMKKLPFVNWDRFIVNDERKVVNLFGWIPRKDTHEDFVLLEYKLRDDDKWDTTFTCSSIERTKEIFKLLECEGKHHDCQRVEHDFDIENCIKLKK